MAYSISSSTHHALSETETAPIDRIAAKEITHSGRLRIAMPTRSPGRDAVAVHQRVAQGVHLAMTSSKVHSSSS